MELTQARYFVAVADAQHFTRAAERCSVSQPALTAAIKRLEQELGGPLFHRDRRGAKLTTLGAQILRHAQRLIEASEAASECAANYQRLKNVPLRVGVIPTIGPVKVAEALEVFRARAPDVELEIHIDTPAILMMALEEADLEIVISNVGDAVPDWSVVKRLYRERYFVLLPPEHPLASKSEIMLDELSRERYIDRSACELREEVRRLCRERSVDLYAIYRTEREAWIECLVRAGIGFALMPEYSIVGTEAIKRVLVEPEVHRDISIVRCVDHALSPAGQTLWDTLVGRADAEGA